MTQQEHLQLIRAKCVELLERAKQRTPGAWRVLDKDDECPGIEANKTSIVIWGGEDDKAGVRTGLPDAAFIASAAGPFEAALASTVAAIDNLDDMPCTVAEILEDSILASWPLELLQQ